MISKNEFISKLDTAAVTYIQSANTVVVNSSKALIFTFENDSLVSFISGYEMRRLFNVKSVEVTSKIISIVDGTYKYEISMS